MPEFTHSDFFRTICGIPSSLRMIYKVDKKYISGLIVLTLINGVIPVISLLISQELINTIISGGQLSYIISVYVVIQICSAVVTQLNSYFGEKIGFLLSYNLSTRLMERVAMLKLPDFEQSTVYNLVEKLNQGVSYKPLQLLNAILSLLSSTVSLFLSLYYIGSWRLEFALLLLIIPILSLVLFIKVGQMEFLLQWKRADKERKVWYLNYLLTHDFSFKEIKLNGISDYLINEYKQLKEQFILQDLSISRKKISFNLLLGGVLNIIGLVGIVFMVLLIRQGKLLLGNMVSLIQAFGRVDTYSQDIIHNIYIINNSNLYMEQLLMFLDDSSQSDKQCNSVSKVDISEVEFRDVSYIYNGNNTPAVKSINLKLLKNELVAIIGKNGSGKSTLVKLLAGLYIPSKGVILYDNLDFKDNETFFQNNISALFQDFVKYELSLKENICLGDLSKMDIEESINLISHDFNIDFIKRGGRIDLDTQLGSWFNNGRQLSGGQWQKIALLRTFFKEAPIVILDEPSSALDPISEKQLFDTFKKNAKDKISIFISHNIKSAQKADKIVVLDNGEIVGVGTHVELLHKCPEYQEIYYSEEYGNV
ncbi:ABC transporter ATP-binding protein [Streptococcus sp. KHUD_011]|jgi:nisin transport ATP-binding protein nisT|uniref:ABC transporter ATP-binding protein n=1 Tax=Streptococcus sp. KHUD_011 TaxID=3157334 RepID=UPI003965AE27